MAIETLTKPRIWMGPYDVSGDLASTALKHGRDQKDNTTFGMAGRGRKAGLYETTAEHRGYWNGAAPGDLMFGQVGLTGVPVTIAPANTYGADGELAYSFSASHASYEMGDADGNMLPFTVKAENAADRLIRGTMMHSTVDSSNVAVIRTTSSTGTIRQLGAVAAGQNLYIGTHVIAGTGTLTLVVASATLVGFGVRTVRYTSPSYTTIGSSWDVVAGAITDTWWRVEWTVASSPSFQFAVVLGII